MCKLLLRPNSPLIRQKHEMIRKCLTSDCYFPLCYKYIVQDFHNTLGIPQMGYLVEALKHSKNLFLKLFIHRRVHLSPTGKLVRYMTFMTIAYQLYCFLIFLPTVPQCSFFLYFRSLSHTFTCTLQFHV